MGAIDLAGCERTRVRGKSVVRVWTVEGGERGRKRGCGVVVCGRERLNWGGGARGAGRWVSGVERRVRGGIVVRRVVGSSKAAGNASRGEIGGEIGIDVLREGLLGAEAGDCRLDTLRGGDGAGDRSCDGAIDGVDFVGMSGGGGWRAEGLRTVNWWRSAIFWRP